MATPPFNTIKKTISQAHSINSVDLSIIIVHYKTKLLTLDCLRSIYSYPPTGGYEILVLDNGSNDGIQADLLDEFPETDSLKRDPTWVLPKPTI